ncbi:MAG: hypothetical protein K8F93_01590 [Burkholderiales bacterium]|nr:hypothetical protein [Burkholderiales bacterium]MBX3717593.1 hypothetical protein [Burkholderiales bacterium]MBZ0248324.1 hypothetical protein [Burkholderiales bacterium]
MRKPSLRAYRIVSLFLLGCLLFNYPVLAVFNVGATAAGIPVLYVYLFVAWGLLIALAAAIIEGGS